MRSLTAYLSVLQKLEKQAAIRLESRSDHGHLWIRGIEFIPTPAIAVFSTEFQGKGILVHDLSREAAAYCQANEISFLTSKGSLFLVEGGHRLLLERRAQKRQTTRKKRSGAMSPGLPPPTTLISPNGFAILDALFRMDKEKLSAFGSALSFVRECHLNQSKLSQMMTHLRVKTLMDLKTRIRALPDEWWTAALR
jgi:hypothetical protein